MGGDIATISDSAKASAEATAVRDKCCADAFGQARGDSAVKGNKSESPCSSKGGCGGTVGKGAFLKAASNMPLIGGLLKVLGIG